MLVLFETPEGLALFKVLDEIKLSQVKDLSKEFSSADSAREVVELKAFFKFENPSEALEPVTKITESQPSKRLRMFLSANCDGETLAVSDSKLRNAIEEQLKIECVHNDAVMEVMRGLRSQLTELISHSSSRYKLKFSPDKVDRMIIQPVGLLDDLDEELDTNAMRVSKWYGGHFPELAEIVQDNILYAKAVKLMGGRNNAAKIDFSEILSDVVESELKDAAMISMGTEVSEEDLMGIRKLCDQVLSLAEYRAPLYDYLKSGMNTIAPSLTALVGDLVGARLIAHAGSLWDLAKEPGSTIQILGAEKVLFRAVKTKYALPKYGILYHASLVGQAAPKIKGKIARSLAAKVALAARYDAFAYGQDNSMGLENRAKLDARLRNLEGRQLGRSAGSAKGKPLIEAQDKDKKKGGLIIPSETNNPDTDVFLGKTPNSALENEEKKRKSEAEPSRDGKQAEESPVSDQKKGKKKKKKKTDEDQMDDRNGAAEPEVPEVKKEKKKKKKHQTEDKVQIQNENADEGEMKKEKKKKRKQHQTENEEQNQNENAYEREKKKKKKHKQAEADE